MVMGCDGDKAVVPKAGKVDEDVFTQVEKDRKVGVDVTETNVVPLAPVTMLKFQRPSCPY